MTTNHHTPITTGAPANASTVNNPLGQLDSVISDLTTSLTNSAQTIGAWIPLYSHTLTANGEFDVDLSTGLATTCDHLMIKVLLRTTGVNPGTLETLEHVHIVFNNDTTTANGNYYRQNFIGRGPNPVANLQPSAQVVNAPNANAAANLFGFATIEIPYFRSGHKKIVGSSYYAHATDNVDAWAGQFAVLWTGTDAITRIRIRNASHPTLLLATNSKIQVWGIKSLDVLTSGS